MNARLADWLAGLFDGLTLSGFLHQITTLDPSETFPKWSVAFNGPLPYTSPFSAAEQRGSGHSKATVTGGAAR
jgi:hypothetical protein